MVIEKQVCNNPNDEPHVTEYDVRLCSTCSLIAVNDYSEMVFPHFMDNEQRKEYLSKCRDGVKRLGTLSLIDELGTKFNDSYCHSCKDFTYGSRNYFRQQYMPGDLCPSSACNGNMMHSAEEKKTFCAVCGWPYAEKMKEKTAERKRRKAKRQELLKREINERIQAESGIP